MSGPGLGRRGWLLFGLLPPKIPPMLVMLRVGVISLRGAPLALPTFATAQFRRFFDCGRAVRCLLSSWLWKVHALGCLVRLSRCKMLMLSNLL